MMADLRAATGDFGKHTQGHQRAGFDLSAKMKTGQGDHPLWITVPALAITHAISGFTHAFSGNTHAFISKTGSKPLF
jgi:hypothetical protein